MLGDNKNNFVMPSPARAILGPLHCTAVFQNVSPEFYNIMVMKYHKDHNFTFHSTQHPHMMLQPT